MPVMLLHDVLQQVAAQERDYRADHSVQHEAALHVKARRAQVPATAVTTCGVALMT
jgi:hypothetical protein